MNRSSSDVGDAVLDRRHDEAVAVRSDPEGERAALQTLRALLSVTSRAEAARVLQEAVVRLGGEVVPADQSRSRDSAVIPVDVSLGVGAPAEVRVADPADGRLARQLARLVEDALTLADRADERARLGLRATVDSLTGVASQGQVARRLGGAQTGDVICVLDLNGFKQLNDTMGHLAGDEVLRRFGAHLQKKTRQGDFVARSGGDEFIVLMEGAGTSLAHQRMAELAMSWAQDEQMTTVSIGVAAINGSGPMAAAAAADRAMYRAKRGGTVAVEIAGAADEHCTPPVPLGDTYDAYLATLASADAPAALALLEQSMDRGVPKQDLMRHVIARGQGAVGERWAAGDWGVAEEHAATAVADQVLTLITQPSTPSSTATRVVLACAEGEWHTMPARLAAELGRSPELDIVVLGGSIPSAELGASLRVLAPAVLALSVTMPTNLIGAHRCIRAARAQGVGVIVGGAAWGSTQLRAQKLGASLMLEDAGELARSVRERDARPGATRPPDIPAEALLLELPPQELIKDALDLWAAGRELGAAERCGALEALDWTARHAAAAVACDDPTVVRDLLKCQVGDAERLGRATKPIQDAYHALASIVATTAPRAAAILRGEALLLAA